MTPIQNTQSSFRLYCEIDMTGSIDNIDGVILPVNIGCGRNNRNTALLFELHEIHGGSNSILTAHFMDRMNFLAEKQNALRKRRLPLSQCEH